MGDNDAVDFQLAAYYLDCISRDRDDKVSAYLTNAYGNVEYNQVFSRPEADVADAASYSTDARALFAKVRRSPTSLQRLVVFCPTYDTSLRLDSCMHELKENKYAGKTVVLGCETISKARALRTGADAYAKDFVTAVRLAKWLAENEKSCSGYEQVRHLATDCLS